MANKIAIVLSVLALVLSGYAVASLPSMSSPTLGAVGVKLIEQYDPYVKYNGGINTALPIQTSSFLTSSTLKLTNGTFCTNFYATSTATALHLVASTTPTLPHGAAAVVTANYGACTN